MSPTTQPDTRAYVAVCPHGKAVVHLHHTHPNLTQRIAELTRQGYAVQRMAREQWVPLFGACEKCK